MTGLPGILTKLQRFVMEQRVSRADLASPESTTEPASDPEVIARLKQLGDFDFVQRSEDTVGHGDETHDDDGDDLDFQLFATSKTTAAPANRIRLRSPTPTVGEPGFVQANRDSSYYFAPTLSSKDKDNLQYSALSGVQVLTNAHIPWPGSAYPWKILHLPSSSLTRSARSQSTALLAKRLEAGAEPKKRTRPGKNFRIKVRTKLAASKAAVERKEAEEREKRTRRNREKKVKKKMREKAKKGGAEGSTLDAVGGESEEGG